MVPDKVALPPGHPLMQLQNLGFTLGATNVQANPDLSASNITSQPPTNPQAASVATQLPPPPVAPAQIPPLAPQVNVQATPANLQPLPVPGSVPPPPVVAAQVPPLPSQPAFQQVAANVQGFPTAGSVPPPPVMAAQIPPLPSQVINPSPPVPMDVQASTFAQPSVPGQQMFGGQVAQDTTLGRTRKSACKPVTNNPCHERDAAEQSIKRLQPPDAANWNRSPSQQRSHSRQWSGWQLVQCPSRTLPGIFFYKVGAQERK